MPESRKSPLSASRELAMRLGGLRGFYRLACRFVPFALQYWDKLVLIVLHRVNYAAMSLIGALAAGKLVDALAAGDGPGFFKWATLAFMMALGVLIDVVCAVTVQEYVRMRVNLKLKRLIFNHVLRMPQAFHESRPIGENMFRINDDTTVAAYISVSVIPAICEPFISTLLGVSALFMLNPLFALLIAVYIIGHFAFSHYVMGYAYRLEAYTRTRQQSLKAILQEGLSAYAISKAMSRERHEMRRFYGRLTELFRARLAYAIVRGIWDCGGSLLLELMRQPVYILLSGAFIISGRMTLGDFVAVQGLVMMVVTPLLQFIWMVQTLRVLSVPAQRMLETIDLEPEIQDPAEAVELPNPHGRIAFERVYFRYSPDGPDVVRDLSFTLEPGKKLAIVGVSGAGKTSIFNLLMRFADPTQGCILIDGIDLRDIRLESYLEHVSIVLQDNFLFSASIRDNLLVGQIHATEAQVEQATERAGLWPTVNAAPNGMDTVLLEGGNLSAGQKQRIAIARAVIRDPRFLYLDEATSSLDPVTEETILEQLAEIEPGKTRIVIAHRITSVQNADEILVMEHGVCVQRGRHEELLAADGAYRRLWAAEKHKVGLASQGAPQEGAP